MIFEKTKVGEETRKEIFEGDWAVENGKAVSII